MEEIAKVFGIHWKLLAAQMVNFSIALFVLHRYVYKPIFAILEKRQQKLAQGLEDAELVAQEKVRIEVEGVKVLAHAREEGGKLVETLRKQGLDEEHRILREAQEKSVAMLGDAKKLADEERVYMLRESEKEVARMAVLAAEKILRTSNAKA